MVSSLIHTCLIVREWLFILVYQFGWFQLRLSASAEFRFAVCLAMKTSAAQRRSQLGKKTHTGEMMCGAIPPTTTWHRSINSHHHRPPSSLLCLCICCSLQGRCSYEGEAAGRYSPPPTHTFPPSPSYDYLSMYPSARITPHPPPQPAQSEHSHLSPQAAPLYELHWPSSPDNYNG